MKNLFTLLLWLCAAGSVMAQSVNPGKLSGSVTDSLTAKPVPYANVVLKDGDKLLTGTAADGEGAFVLPNLPLGNFILELTFLGYRSQTIPIKLTAAQPSVKLGAIKLGADSKMLSAVEVTGMKAIVEDKGDRLVYNAEKDISNSGGTAADVLRKVPTLNVDLDGNVQMRGNSNIKILINGKPSGMMARNLADALRQMPANTIKSVEVITSPGAKYDAEGSAGVINIITKKGLQGFNGSTNVTVGNFNRSLGTNLNYRKNKFGISLSANGYQYRNKWENNLSRTSLINGAPAAFLYQSSNADNTGTGGYGEMSIDYDPDSTSRINFSANVWGGNYPNNTTMRTSLFDLEGTELLAYRNESRFRNPYGNGQLDLGYTKTFKKKGQEFSLLTQFSRMPDNYFYETDTYSGADEITYRQNSSNYSRNKEYTVQTDYVHPFEVKSISDTLSFKLEVGAKAIRRDIGSEYRVEIALNGNGDLEPDPTQSNDFNYFQRVYSGYTSLRMSTKSKWSLNAGARLEHTEIKGDFVSTNTSLSNQYNNLIPSITISKGFKKQTLKISYTQRIQRPLIWYLNPWLNASDTLNISTGNPYLDPELSHAVELAHSLNTDKGLSVNTSLYWRYADNAIEYLSTVNEEGVSLNRPENIAKRKAYGVNLNLAGQPNKNWSLNGGADLRYVDLTSPGQNQRNNGFVWSFNMNSTYKLPKNYSLQANGSVSSGWISLQSNNSGYYWYGIAAKREFWDNKASLTLNLNNPFNKGIRQTGTRSAPSFESEFSSYYINRSARLTFEWRFGQMKEGSSKRSKKISNDDTGNR
ncbi:TonB-dependent receptor domain-containing protein [Pontibacter silvestris]|uniref:TonB-dependent receptor domain-containing protein n=1 Tax=Pontibacter silvestris TaxID=2305183 RepID=A0ABW4WV41_9BACT|nr:outer membrane beta-barrel family protein [Pontibacter silvestris]MCC9138638.1 TonB-dependent receptor [Pontibacter silvestris]